MIKLEGKYEIYENLYSCDCGYDTILKDDNHCGGCGRYIVDQIREVLEIEELDRLYQELEWYLEEGLLPEIYKCKSKKEIISKFLEGHNKYCEYLKNYEKIKIKTKLNIFEKKARANKLFSIFRLNVSEHHNLTKGE